MQRFSQQELQQAIHANVSAALAEDVGDGDITAMLVPAEQRVQGRVIAREDAVLAGSEWATEVFRRIDPSVELQWHYRDGQAVQCQEDNVLFTFKGPARAILTGERSALNFLQTLSAVATRCSYYLSRVSHTSVTLLDTRKTLPGLRLAQKYAATCGGFGNHRLGLFDAFLIKENHIAAAGSIAAAVTRAHEIAPGKTVEIEVEDLAEFDQALEAGADIIMLDEFSLEHMREAVRRCAGRARLEASGGVNDSTLVAIAETGVDFISMGTVTKDIQAVDLSLRITSGY
ncbi:carboxylating nicotinate-nucleotide diphosphorylase [Hydrocarboniclastica marina]|uniref:Probable nicotinate-nucleotide pyrophosphorylase [carboxylating] n=1 Tax=Hydrocarboniclastica marina TaxID=2259620 RepID=A0A4P7XH61_9ALTE|nr:carboxylating nicotinate-nucleotide diphosphorylase [Hydrocarboniclastica marina]QCF26346.1 carboxylating nicotinate-nucleotide diphosphorylase [Hydrocarboniclastica marina]